MPADPRVADDVEPTGLEVTDSSGPHELGAVMALSESERRFERWRQTVGLFVGPLLFLVVWLAPMPGLTEQAHRLAAVVALVVTWWMTEPVPLAVTALLGTALTVVAGVAPAQEAFAPFASPTIFLFLGSFMIGRAASEHGLDRRLAWSLLSLPLVGGSVLRIAIAIGALTMALSAWMSNTATTAMMLPVATGLLQAVHRRGARLPRQAPPAFLLSIAYAASIGGIVTPVGTPPNLITLGLLDKLVQVRVNFLVWMIIATPISVAMGAALFLLVGRHLSTGASRPAPMHVSDAGRPPAGWSAAQRNVALAFGLAVAGWITPGLAALLWPDANASRWLSTHLDEAVVAVLAAMLLFVLPIDFARRRFTLDWTSAAQIDWGTILLFGGGLALGHQMFATGLASHLGQRLVVLSGADTLWTITLLGIVVAVVLTEVTSNTAATNMLVPVMLSVAQASGVPPVPPALGACLGASMAFMLPVSTPPNAIVYGTGLVPVLTMVRYGVLMDLLSIGIIFVGLRLLCPLFGLA